MKRISGLIFTALIAVSLLLLVLRPDLLEKVWLWIVGLAGPIIGFVQQSVNALIASPSKKTESPTIPAQSAPGQEVDFQKKEIVYRREIVELKKKIESLETHL